MAAVKGAGDRAVGRAGCSVSALHPWASHYTALSVFPVAQGVSGGTVGTSKGTAFSSVQADEVLSNGINEARARK